MGGSVSPEGSWGEESGVVGAGGVREAASGRETRAAAVKGMES